MRKPFIRPTGLKGNEKLDRMRELMGASQLNEDVKNSVVELTKIGPDGKVYGIVREGHNYFIKVTNKKSNLVTEDFKYIGGLMNKTSEAYPTYAKAIKQLNLKFMSLNEAYGKQGNFNVFEDDNLLNKPLGEEESDEDKIQRLVYNTGMDYVDAVNMVRGNNLEELNSLTEHHPYKADQKLSATKGMGDGAEYIIDKAGVELSYDSKEGKDDSQFGDNLADKDVMDEFESVKLSENEMAIENMLGIGAGATAAITEDSLYEAEDVARVVDKVEDKIEDILSPEEIQFLKSQNPETIANVIDDKIDEADDNTGRLKNIIDKIVKNTTIASLIGAPVAMMTQAAVKAATGIPGAHGVISGGQNIISPEVIIGLAITGVAGLAIINSDWWVKRFGKNDTNQKLKESRKGFSIQTALEKMDSIIEEVTTDKVTEILNSLTESEKEALLSTLKKKV